VSFDAREATGSDLGKPTPTNHARLQFSIRHLLILMLVLSVVFAVLFAFPNWLAAAVLSVASILLLAVLTTFLVYARGHTRAFCIGAFFPTFLAAIPVACIFVVMTFEWSRNGFRDAFEELENLAGGLRFATMTGALMAIAAGTLSVIVWRRLARGRTGD